MIPDKILDNPNKSFSSQIPFLKRHRLKGMRPFSISGESNMEVITLCDATDCKNKTYGNKPFCIDHIDKMPYIKNLLVLIDKAQS